MPKPIALRIVIRVLIHKGFFFVSQKGSHAKYRKTGSPTKTVILKVSRKEIPYGTFQSILLLSGLKESDFREG